MIPNQIVESSLDELNKRSRIVVGACGYEQRASALLPSISESVTDRFALAFKEELGVLHRPENDKKFHQSRFTLIPCSGNASDEVREVIEQGIAVAKKAGGALAFDISSMTRAWHGAIVQTLIALRGEEDIETYFVYVPRHYDRPPKETYSNEIVGPVQGFAALTPPDLPIALLLSLGYEREKALGLMEILDPGRTVLLIANSTKNKPHFSDPFFSGVIRNNREILKKVSERWVFSYPLSRPATTFRMLESICGGLRLFHRIVLAPMGPKLFALLCFLLAAKQPEVSVWRMSSGIHAKPKDAFADLARITTLKVIWSPRAQEDPLQPS
jgi:hypothetical protein